MQHEIGSMHSLQRIKPFHTISTSSVEPSPDFVRCPNRCHQPGAGPLVTKVLVAEGQHDQKVTLALWSEVSLSIEHSVKRSLNRQNRGGHAIDRDLHESTGIFLSSAFAKRRYFLSKSVYNHFTRVWFNIKKKKLCHTSVTKAAITQNVMC